MPELPRQSDVTAEQLREQGAIQAAVRAIDMPDGPYVPSRSRHCSRCKLEVWISEGAFPLADELPILCVPCIEATSAAFSPGSP